MLCSLGLSSGHVAEIKLKASKIHKLFRVDCLECVRVGVRIKSNSQKSPEMCK